MITSVEEQISRVPLYQRLTEQDRIELASVCYLETYERGSEVFAEGDPADRFFTVVDGRIKVFKGTPDGRVVILEIFGPGDPVGAVAVYEELPYPATAVALEPTICLCIPRADFFGLWKGSLSTDQNSPVESLTTNQAKVGPIMMRSNMRQRVVVVVPSLLTLIMVVVVACGGGDGTGGGDKEAAAGQRLFMANCGLCHGQDAEGKPKLGKGLRGNEFVAGLTDEELVTFLQEGRRANHPLNERGVDMPPRGGNPGLSDDDLRQIGAYLRSLS